MAAVARRDHPRVLVVDRDLAPDEPEHRCSADVEAGRRRAPGCRPPAAARPRRRTGGRPRRDRCRRAGCRCRLPRSPRCRAAGDPFNRRRELRGVGRVPELDSVVEDDAVLVVHELGRPDQTAFKPFACSVGYTAIPGSVEPWHSSWSSSLFSLLWAPQSWIGAVGGTEALSGLRLPLPGRSAKLSAERARSSYWAVQNPGTTLQNIKTMADCHIIGRSQVEIWSSRVGATPGGLRIYAGSRAAAPSRSARTRHGTVARQRGKQSR